MWIICQADNSQKMSRLAFLENNNNNKIYSATDFAWLFKG